jgi:hypothetical protein
MSEDTCDQCQEKGRLGPELRAYSFATPKGKNVVRILHASDGGKRCYYDFKARYDAYMAEQKAKAVSNG